MTEKEWVQSFLPLLQGQLAALRQKLVVTPGTKLAYAFEITDYALGQPRARDTARFYETDLLVAEEVDATTSKPRVVIEAKLRSITTHDAITYSEKAAAHKRVHPYLRYGVLIGDRKHYPLPGRLYRHGAYFDFMLSWVGTTPTQKELRSVSEVLAQEVRASQQLEEILYSSRSPGRRRYTVLHRPLVLK